MESQSGKTGSFKRLRRNPANESRELNLKEEERKREISRREQELEAIQQKILEKRRSVNELRSRLKSSVSALDEATSGYPRLKTITSHTKQFELVSEQDIASAQVEVARNVEPQLVVLTEKAVQIIYDLENKEYQIMARIQEEEKKANSRIQQQKATRSGISNIKKLQSLTRRKEELSRSATELDEVLDQKRQEFSDLVNTITSMESQSGKTG
ncbi:hypothetical protein BGZ49_004970, partial [Haplosporangium sp. Z 27]